MSVVVTVAVMVTPGGRYGVTWRPSAGGNTVMRRLSVIMHKSCAFNFLPPVW